MAKDKHAFRQVVEANTLTMMTMIVRHSDHA